MAFDDGWDAIAPEELPEIPKPEDAPAGPRVTPEDIANKVKYCVFFTGGEAARAFGPASDFPVNLEALTVCILVLENGFSVVGRSAPAAPENFDAHMGRELAYKHALDQVWPLEGYLLREQLHEGAMQVPQAEQAAPTRSALLILDDGGETRRFREV